MKSSSRLPSKRKPSPSNYYQRVEAFKGIVKVMAVGKIFLNGITNKYESSFPSQLQGLVDRKKYQQNMQHLNRKISQFWPCTLAYLCGYLCIPLTFGLSLLVPRVCIRQTQAVLRKQISRINLDLFGNGKLYMRLVKNFYNSYLVIEERDFAEFELKNDVAL